MRFFSKVFKIVAAFALVGLICCIPAYIVVFKILPTHDPDNQFNRATILQVLSGETRVYYNDGDQLLGAFFDANHRVYVPYGDIPTNIVNALIAAEDAGYWHHNGFSIYGFTRAMITNLKSGHMRQGGSTLTQQTVKNIFGREERSIKEKWKELINALRMENHFSKEEILEFYLVPSTTTPLSNEAQNAAKRRSLVARSVSNTCSVAWSKKTTSRKRT